MKKEVTPPIRATPTELINICAALPDDTIIQGLEAITDIGNSHFVKKDNPESIEAGQLIDINIKNS
jgi:hypothetical protein